MVSKLAMLYNTLLTIETKGGHTKTMADCLRFLEQLMSEENVKEEEAKTKNAEDVDAATAEKKGGK